VINLFNHPWIFNQKISIMRIFLILFLLAASYSSGVSQEIFNSKPKLIGSCEGCEAIFEYGEKKLTPADTLVDFKRPGAKLKLTGTIYQNDGKTPARDVILYIYHTNQNGIYETTGNETGWGKRHGRIRGWIKTDTDGGYNFYTLKPGTYPSRSEPAHVHPIILEPNGNHYWLGSYYFDDDPLLTQNHRNPDSQRGGSNGIMILEKENGIWVGRRDITLGKNIPGYE
jgi:protocatechuate 3,4-dioxygenase beta subunit